MIAGKEKLVIRMVGIAEERSIEVAYELSSKEKAD